MTKTTAKWLTYIISLWVFICIGYITYMIIKEVGFLITCLNFLIVYLMYRLGLWYKNYIGWYTKPYYSIMWMPLLVLLLIQILLVPIILIIG